MIDEIINRGASIVYKADNYIYRFSYLGHDLNTRITTRYILKDYLYWTSIRIYTHRYKFRNHIH